MKNLLRFKAVCVNGTISTRFDHLLQPGDEVLVSRLTAARGQTSLAQAGIEIIHEDHELLVINKPAGLLTVATDQCKTDTAYARVNDCLRRRQPAAPSAPT